MPTPEDTVFQSLEAIREALRQIEHEFSRAMSLADKASSLLKERRLGLVPSEVEEPSDGPWYYGPARDNASDQLDFIYDVLRSKQSDIGFVQRMVDEAVWLIANGRIES